MIISKQKVYFFLFLIIFVFSQVSGFCNGKPSKRLLFSDYIEIEDGKLCRFKIEFVDVMFLINSINNKYKVLHIEVDNNSSNSIVLSKEKDKIDIHFKSHSTISGILNLAEYDATLWDSFSSILREKLVYPKILEKNEVDDIFIFIANPDLNEIPRYIQFRVDSLPQKQINLMERGIEKK